MKILNGRWVDDDNESRIDNFNVGKLLSIGQQVQSMFGKEITHHRIEMVATIADMNEQQSFVLAEVLASKKMSKIIGIL